MLIAIHQQAERFFRAHYDGSWVPTYLEQRGFDRFTQHHWRTGYAPNDWRALTNHLRDLGYGDTAIEASGLARRTTRGTLVDHFRDRAMFPIKEHDGTTVAFIGRSRDGDPKYLNSPRTPIYAKSQTLFGLHAITPDAKPVITEGPLDAIAVTLTGRGYLAGLALCGTALTSDQVKTLRAAKDLSGNGVLLAFDSDRAGREAAVRSYALFRHGCTAEAVMLPDGRDPADVLRHGGREALATLLHKQARPLADLVVDAAIEPWQRSIQDAEGRLNALRSAGRAIATLAPHDVARQVTRVAARLNFDHAMVTETAADSVTTRLAVGDFPAPPTTGSATPSTRGRGPSERPLRGPTP
ncbi:toprim domain-containing protein [Planotetraspora sp. A-T 1434]|uniref:toprim domain-containing protein n=1 Tax=Planotetraspora sp. A-T 1434 TaxID=2979219 RepID=UPI0021BDF57E|nr:toprim domain-containing protein [Planotetraspora sp. A-T 1434]MCT9934948.1 toprim domain-containing protein [Planotetraspora sp. A-T 1434]